MEHRDIRRELAGRLGQLLAPDEQLPKPLRPYQRETIEKTRSWLEDPGGLRRAYVQHATGLGKTVEYSSLLRYMAGLRTLVIVPSKLLIEQTAREIVGFTGGIVGHISSLGDVLDKSREVIAMRGHQHQSIVLTTDASLKSRPREIAKAFGPHLIIRDECHWGYSERSQDALAHFPESVIMGYSATPDYLGTVAHPDHLPVRLENGHVLYGHPKRLARTHFGERLDVRTAQWGMAHGWLCPLAWARIDFRLSLDNVRIQDGPGGYDYEEAALQHHMREHWSAVCDAVCRLYRSNEYNLRDRQVFAVCPGVREAEILAERVAAEGVPARCVTAGTKDRRDILDAYDRREITFLSSVAVLREGWDAPDAEVCLMLRVTKSLVFYKQPIGRILRLSLTNPSKVALAVDLHFQNTAFAPLSAPLVYGKSGETIEENTIIVQPDDGNGSGHRLPSLPKPNLPANAKPRLVIVQSPEIEYWAHDDDTFEADGRVWATFDALCGFFDLDPRAMTRTLFRGDPAIPSREGKNRHRQKDTFYRLMDVERKLGRFAVRTPPFALQP